jgi:two-component system phosphate regulon sensor histidine kinase PhoR
VKKPTPIKRVALILLLIILLPALFFSGYQISTISESEELMSEVYRRQLDAILFSLNQYALDVANSWMSSLTILLNEQEQSPVTVLRTGVQTFSDRIPSINAVFRTDSTLRAVELLASARREATNNTASEDILAVLHANREKVARLVEFRREQYRKLEPFSLDTPSSGPDRIALTFSVGSESRSAIAGLVIDERTFIRDIILRKIQEAAGTEFTLGVVRNGERIPVVSSSMTSGEELRQRRAMWLLPGYSLGIRLRGETIEDLVHVRTSRNLLLIVLLDIVLFAGVLFVYRSIRKEMELARIKSDFVSNVSHELRTPLALIRMYAETLEMGRLSNEEKRKEYYGTIVRESERLTRLVNNILNFSSMEAGKKQYHFMLVQLNDVVSGVMETYSVHLKSKGFSPLVELDARLPTVPADSEAVSEALINIIDNAIKYSDREQYLSVRSGMEGRMVFLEVQDHGIGIPASQQQKVFDMFYRVSTGHVHDRKGTGIGLALVKHIMTAHRGEVTVRSAPGKGSTFRLLFPVTEREK